MGTSRAAYAAETRVMLRIALPIVASNLLGVTMGMTDLGFIGRVGREELAAAALGNTLFYLMHYPMLGVMTAVDTLLATAHGAKQPRAYGDWTQTGIVAVTALCVPVGATMMFVGPILRGIGQSPHLASLADAFCKQLVWGLPPYYWFQVLTKYLQAQHVLAPPVYVALVSNGANVLLNWLLIFRLGRGFSGAPVATSLCRWVQLALLIAYLALWPAERSRETRPKAILPGARLRECMRRFAALAGPGAAMMLIEAWSFEITTLLAGYLGVVALDAHLTMLQLATLAFLSLPFATAIASTIRVGNLLGGGDGAAARTAAATTFGVCAAFTAVCGAVFAGAANHLGKIFTNDRDVIRATGKIAYIAALFQLADGAQAAAGGVFRGMGRQRTVAWRNFLGFWVFGIPVGAVLTFVAGAGLAGLWWGLVVGLSAAATISVVDISRVRWDEEAVKAAARGRAPEGDAGAKDAKNSDNAENVVVVVDERSNKTNGTGGAGKGTDADRT